MSKLSEAMALMAGHEDSEGVAEFVLDTFRGEGDHAVREAGQSLCDGS
jgi:hypothetical protein